MISVIIPVYNSEKYLDSCIQSVLSQLDVEFEVLLINDGSTDKSGYICDQYAKQDPRIIVFHSENKGVSSARNLGLLYSRGEWVTFVDSDDTVAPNMLQSLLVAAMAENADIAYCDFNMVYSDKVEPFRLADTSATKKELIRNWILNVWTVVAGGLYRRSLFYENSIVFPVEYNYCEDFTVSVKLRWFSQKTIHVKECFYNYIRYNNSSLTNALEDVKLPQEILAFNDILNFLRSQGADVDYEEFLYWRFLDLKQNWCTDKNTFFNYYNYLPQSLDHIWNCPKLSFKRKLVIWCISCHFLRLAELLLRINNLYTYAERTLISH